MTLTSYIQRSVRMHTRVTVLTLCVCVCVCVSAVFWLHKTFMQHFEHGNRLCVKHKRFLTHEFLWEGFFQELQRFHDMATINFVAHCNVNCTRRAPYTRPVTLRCWYTDSADRRPCSIYVNYYAMKASSTVLCLTSKVIMAAYFSIIANIALYYISSMVLFMPH